VIYLTKRHQFIACEDLFRGTIDGASVYPREVLKEALKHNAAAVILAHSVARHRMTVMCPSSFCSLLSDWFVVKKNFFRTRHIMRESNRCRPCSAELDGWLYRVPCTVHDDAIGQIRSRQWP
jgi:hypothetical protein